MTEITDGIKISVEAMYQEEQSNPHKGIYFFAYRIVIVNLSKHPVKLLSRHWFIFDSNGDQREVAGEGVIGQQPIIAPDDSFQYISGCHLKTEMGTMWGYYIFENKVNQILQEAIIPKFQLLAPQKLN